MRWVLSQKYAGLLAMATLKRFSCPLISALSDAEAWVLLRVTLAKANYFSMRGRAARCAACVAAGAGSCQGDKALCERGAFMKGLPSKGPLRTFFILQALLDLRVTLPTGQEGVCA
jgi:hypothetical protein